MSTPAQFDPAGLSIQLDLEATEDIPEIVRKRERPGARKPSLEDYDRA